MLSDFLSKLSIAAPFLAGGEAAQITFSTGSIAWSNWAITTLLGIAVFFLRRVVVQIDSHSKRLGKLENRMIASETHQEDCSWNLGVHKISSPIERDTRK